MKDRNRRLVVLVAALTRQRLIMLQDLLQSWQALRIPPDCQVDFLIVENDHKENSRAIVEAYTNGMGQDDKRLSYTLEPELGIPFGRNHAARYAIKHGADLLVFMDDDEMADPAWLERLVSGYRRSKAVLLGGPMRAQKSRRRPLSWWQGLLYQGIANRYARNEARAARRADLTDASRVTIITSNWLAETDLFAKHGIWFDETMCHTGGTDAKFYHEARAKNLQTGWVHDAVVYETVTLNRLSFWYQLKRACDQSSANLARKIEARPKAKYVAFLAALLRLPVLAFVALSVPLTLGHTLMPFARGVGWTLGRILTVFGYRSQLYAKVKDDTLPAARARVSTDQS